MSATITAEDQAAFTETMQALRPGFKAPGQSGGKEKNGPGDSIADVVADVLDVPTQLTLENGVTVTIRPPTMGALLTLARTLYEVRGNVKGGEFTAEDLTSERVSQMLEKLPAARGFFLGSLVVSGMEFPDDEAKWKWYSEELGLDDAFTVLEMFIAHIDWQRIMGRVKQVMGKLPGLTRKQRA